MRLKKFGLIYPLVLGALVLPTLSFSALAQVVVGVLPKPPECTSLKSLTLPHDRHPDKYEAYGKVDLYCGDSPTAIAKGTTLCNSDYDSRRLDQKTVTIAVSTKTKSGKVAACKTGTDLKFVPE